MDFLGPLVLAVGFSADAFAVSVCKGLSMKKATWRAGMICGLWFGGFQALMPVLGYYLGRLFADGIMTIAPFVSFALLALIGINMIKEAFEPEDCEGCADLSCKTMFLMAIATSIDAMAGGLSIALDVGRNTNIFLTAGLIGVITFLFSTAGVKIGNLFGSRYEKGAQIAGGTILILYGTYILLEHIGVIPW